MFHDETEQHMEDIKNGAVAMLVVVRVRPLTQRQANIDGSEVVKVLDSKMIVMMDANSEEGEKRGKSREAQFSFDFAYGQVILVLERRQRPRTSTMKHSPVFLMASFKATTPPSSHMEQPDAARPTRF